MKVDILRNVITNQQGASLPKYTCHWGELDSYEASSVGLDS